MTIFRYCFAARDPKTGERRVRRPVPQRFPRLWKWPDRSCYMPHQGERERARRAARLNP